MPVRQSEACVELLQRSLLFEHVPVESLHAAIPSMRECHASKGGFCFRQGDPATDLHVLIDGRLKLVRTAAEGHQSIVAVVEPGEWFGLEAILQDAVHRVAAQALMDSRSLSWSGVLAARFMTDHPAAAVSCLRLAVSRLRGAWEGLCDLATERVEPRIARALLRLARADGWGPGGQRRLVLAFSHQDLAEFVGTTPYTVSRVLSRWEDLSIVGVGRERVLIQAPERLAAVAAGNGGTGAPGA